MPIIFDFDGTLRPFSREGIYRGYKAIIRYIGKRPEDYFQNREEFNKKWWQSDWKTKYKRLGIIDKDLEEECNKIFYKVYDKFVPIFPWLHKILPILRLYHLLAIFSNASKENIEINLKDFLGYFYIIVGGNEVKKLKPDPEGIFLIINQLKIPKEKVLLIGDDIIDIIAAKKAGVQSGAVKWGLGNWEELLKLEPDYTFEQPEELLDLIGADDLYD